jgi:hypothetical protein
VYGGQVQLSRVDALCPEGEDAAGGVVGHGVLDADLPVVDARIDDLEAGRHPFGGGQHVFGADPGPCRSSPSMKAISPSARGWIRL